MKSSWRDRLWRIFLILFGLILVSSVAVSAEDYPESMVKEGAYQFYSTSPNPPKYAALPAQALVPPTYTQYVDSVQYTPATGHLSIIASGITYGNRIATMVQLFSMPQVQDPTWFDLKFDRFESFYLGPTDEIFNVTFFIVPYDFVMTVANQYGYNIAEADYYGKYVVTPDGSSTYYAGGYEGSMSGGLRLVAVMNYNYTMNTIMVSFTGLQFIVQNGDRQLYNLNTASFEDGEIQAELSSYVDAQSALVDSGFDTLADSIVGSWPERLFPYLRDTGAIIDSFINGIGIYDVLYISLSVGFICLLMGTVSHIRRG